MSQKDNFGIHTHGFKDIEHSGIIITYISHNPACPADTRRKINVIMMSKRRRDVVLTS